ncbi:rhodanese-like domain-containing protein [Erysipelothrix sp. HDW6A]|uniref:rhodanese-like domain-containing protein n=1 Tax=Erysipelothrix sp. HDW6A TaxID=2714928 RepID=UPI00140895EE|nr:rhodanese-like domain-containing protein [Erysipelothrix sp. HDW6A]QIK57889.1 rhodanese-like domain-containing protein [Erysipelothrix sp. HDW6A]
MFFFKKVPTVTWSDLKPSDQIIDVRERHEFKSGHARNAKNVPLSNIPNFDTNKEVFVVCASGSRSKRAVKILRKKGIDAKNVRGGMMLYGR